MQKNEFPVDAKKSRFGWPQPARVDEFEKLRKADGERPTMRVVFKENIEDLSIIRIPIELPKYRLTNGRTVSLQSEYLAQFPKLRRDLFSGDPELWDAQEAQHGLLLQLGKLSDLRKYFEDASNKQIDPLLLDENGFVVNGNRRLSCWRELLYDDPAKFSHFRHIDVCILGHGDEKEIDRLEAKLQVAPDIKAGYSWDSTANMMLAKQNRDGFSNKELADLYDMKESEVKELLDMRAYADEYLRSQDQSDRWSLVTNDEFAFKKIVSTRAKIAGVGRQELFKQAAFSLIESPEAYTGRLYDAIPDIGENIDIIRDKLIEEFNVATGTATDEVDELFGGSSLVSDQSSDLPLALEIRKSANAERARTIIVEVIETQKQLKKDTKAEGYLLKMCSGAHADLAAAVKSGLRPESKLEGVSKQLDAIDSQVTIIRNYLAEHAKD